MNRLLSSLVIGISFLLLSVSFLTAQPGSDVMIQGFNWVSQSNSNGWYNVVSSKAQDLGNAGIDAIWLPPPSDAGSAEGYLPREWYDLNTNYGTQAELISTINALHMEGISVVADIVINHRVGCTNWADFCNPSLGGCSSIVANDEWGSNGGNPCGSWDTGDNYHAARDLDHTNPTVQTEIINWMNWLKNTIGFDGWRYDYVRGFNGYYTKLYNDATTPYLSVGELWNGLNINDYDPHRQDIVNWIDATQGSSTAFDFTTKGMLQEAVNNQYWRLRDYNGNAPGVIGWWPQKAITFIDNHDTGSTQAYWPFPGNKVMIGYAYILTHPGIPCVFWDHFFDWSGLQQPITDLIQVRKDNGLNSTSNLDIQVANWDLYAAVIDNKVAVKLGPASWSPSGSGWTLRTSGNDYAVWDKSGSSGGGVSNGVYKIEAKHSGKVIDIQYASTSNGANAHQWSYVGANNQQFFIENLGSNLYKISAQHSGKVLDAAGMGTSNGTNVHQWSWVNGANQKWRIEDVGGGYYQIVNDYNNKCLDVSGVSGANGANIHLWDCVGSDNQQWKLDYLSANRESAPQDLESAFRISPNPSSNHFLLESIQGGVGSSSWQIFDIQGRLMEQGTLLAGQQAKIGGELPAGIYLIKFVQQSEHTSISQQKLVKH